MFMSTCFNRRAPVRTARHRDAILGETQDLIQRFFPGAMAALPAIRDCIQVRMSDAHITALLDGKPRSFKTGSMLYDPNEEKDVDVGNVEVQIKRDPTDGKNYRLHLGGKRVFQWFKEK